MASEFLTGIGGVVIGAVGTLLAARLQARGAHAQADAAFDSTVEQTKEAYKNWMASDRAHAYAALVTQTLILENRIRFLTADFNRSGNPWWLPGWRPLGYRQRMSEYQSVISKFVRIQYAAALVDLYGSDEARHRASAVVEAADWACEITQEWALEPADDPPADHVSALQERRELLTRAAREDLRGPHRPAS